MRAPAMTGLSAFWFILSTLAVWRCIVFIRQDNLIEGTRTAVTVRLMRKDTLWRNKLLYLIDCPWCLGIWLAGLAVIAWSFEVDFTATSGIITWLAMSALAAAIDQLADHL